MSFMKLIGDKLTFVFLSCQLENETIISRPFSGKFQAWLWIWGICVSEPCRGIKQSYGGGDGIDKNQPARWVLASPWLERLRSGNSVDQGAGAGIPLSSKTQRWNNLRWRPGKCIHTWKFNTSRATREPQWRSLGQVSTEEQMLPGGLTHLLMGHTDLKYETST